MATQYKDGSFGETLPIDEAFDEFLDAVEKGKAKAFHVGSYDEIEQEKAKQDFYRDIQKSIKELNERLDDVEVDLEEQEDSLIEKPMVSEIKRILNNADD